jgi:hypothetical protein
MFKNMLQLLGALAAVGVLAVAPSVAGAASSSAELTGDGGCNDSSSPWSRWGRNWQGHDGHGPYWRGWGDHGGYFNGYAGDPGCDAFHTGKVARVMVAVDRMRGDRCQHLHASHRLGRSGSCARPHWLRARGTSAWRYDIGRRLPRGRYRIHRRAVDVAGNREPVRHLRLRIR